jgi:hypothetical protein
MLLTRITFGVFFALVVGYSLSVPNASAQAKKEGAEDPAEKEELKQTRQRMLDRWSKMRALVRVADKEQEVDRRKDPIFSYAEPTRETGGVGTMWVWGTSGRPVALLAQGKAHERPIWGFELVALTEGVSVVMHDGWRWSPKSAVKVVPFPDAPPPADSAVRRLSQMKGLVEQFSVSEQYNNESFELRLLPRPIYRYQDDEEGLIDGALFNFAHGTNPEALALIECRKESSGPVWSYGFLPLAGAAVTAKLDGKQVWSKELTQESRAQELYSTWLETDEK